MIFGKGKEQTELMLQIWEETYGVDLSGGEIACWDVDGYTTQTLTDVWSLEAVGSSVGISDSIWFVPSKSEWAAFGGELRIVGQ